MDIKSRLNVVTGDILGGLNAAIITLPQVLRQGSELVQVYGELLFFV